MVAPWVRPFSPNTWKAEVPSVCPCAPGARCASRNAAASSLEKPLTTAMATDPMRPFGWRSAAARVALATEVDVVGLHDRCPAALDRCAQLAPIRLFAHRVAQAFVQITRLLDS